MIAPWHELTPQAQAAARRELEGLFARVPRQDIVTATRAQIESTPEVIPHLIEKLRARLEEEGR